MRVVLIITIAFLVGCGDSREAPQQDEKWPWHIDGVTEVRAFFINPEEPSAFTPLVLDNGGLNPTRQPTEGIALRKDQEMRIREALFRERPPYPMAACFYPHHSLLLFNESGDAIGDIDICFQCNQHASSAEGLAKFIDLAVIAQIMEELGFPIIVEDPRSDPDDPFGGAADPFGDPD
jgi:hypothetical protein